MSVSVMRPFVMAATAAKGVAVLVASCLEIRKGLCEGDMVVTKAGSSLHDGDKVRPILTDAVLTEPR
jgi:hypothetical protein